jgi:hypothetical protein
MILGYAVDFLGDPLFWETASSEVRLCAFEFIPNDEGRQGASKGQTGTEPNRQQPRSKA